MGNTNEKIEKISVDCLTDDQLRIIYGRQVGCACAGCANVSEARSHDDMAMNV